MIPFFILYGITGVVPLIAALYLLLRRGNAFAPEITPPVRLRRWAASFFVGIALGHVWWYLFYFYSRDTHSAWYLVVVGLDSITLLTTIGGTLLAMLQDRRRSVWPVLAAMIPVLALVGLEILYPDRPFMTMVTIYLLSLYVLFSVYMVFAVRRYGQWLNDNYADLENKKVWLSQLVSLVCLLMFILYAFVDVDTFQIYVLHVIELLLFCLLLWRVETLPLLAETSVKEEGCAASGSETSPAAPLANQKGVETLGYIDISQIERLLAERCVDTQLYLQHDLTLQQLAQAVGTNRSYLSQYFSRQGITYNIYINNLRINHFINHYQEVVAANQPFTVQQLVSESGYRSYSTFSLAFKQRMGQSVTTWMRESSL